MTSRILLLGVFCLVSSGGCLYRHMADIELLEAELRWMEDQVYTLEDQLQLKNQQLADCRQRETGSCDGYGAMPGGGFVLSDTVVSSPGDIRDYEVVPESRDNGDANGQRPRNVPTPADGSPTEAPAYDILDGGASPRSTPDAVTDEPPDELDLNNGDTDDGQFMMPPNAILPPDEDVLVPPETSRPRLDQGTQREGVSEDHVAIRLMAHASAAELATTATPLDAHVTHVVVQAWIAHGRGFDGKRRDVDLLLLIEPRNADAHPVPLGAPLSLVVLDGGQTGPAARVARWDYTAAEARRLLRRTKFGHGMHLELQWPEDVPESDNLHVFARYETVEGEQLESEGRVEPNLPNRPAIHQSGWQRVSHPLPAAPDGNHHHQDDDVTTVVNGIRLRPIPKSKKSTPADSQAQAEEEEEESVDRPTIVSDELPPQWRPER